MVKGWDLPAGTGSSLSPVPRPPVGLGQAILVVMVLFLADYFFLLLLTVAIMGKEFL